MSAETEIVQLQAGGLLSGFTMSDFVMIFAVLAAPVIAVQVDRFLEKKRGENERKLSIFKTLMSTRGKLIDPRHVEALNMIDLEFDGVRRVTEAWKAYLDHLNNAPKYPAFEEKSDEEKWSEKTIHDSKMEAWGNQREEFLADLLHNMGASLNYKFDKTHIKRSIYAPQAHADVENEQQFIRRSLIDLLMGRRALPIEAVTAPLSNEEAQRINQEQAEQQQMRELLIKHYRGDAETPIFVKIVDEKEV